MNKAVSSDGRDMPSVSIISNVKKINRCRSFHFRYLELCRSKNVAPLTDIRSKNNVTSALDFFGDKLNTNDWLLIVEALYYDQVLQTLGIRMRKTFGTILDHLDSEKKAKLFRQRPVIYTKFVFNGVVEAVSNCIEYNKNLRILHLEGLPLNDKYIEMVGKALSSNESIKEISFQRSNICDKGCEVICNTIKYLEHVEKLNLSECELTTKGADCVADMIKIQKISRFTEGWQKSLRYRDVNPDTLPGLRAIYLNRNPQIGDDGVKSIIEVLKEDAWIKIIDMEQCGLTDRAANMVLDCLEINNYITEFNVRNNNGISKFLQRNIREQLGKDNEEQKLQDELITGPNGIVIKQSKQTLAQLKEQVKTLEEQLAFEKMLRKKAEQLNEKLNQQIIIYENQIENGVKATIPDGYVIVKNESLQSILNERNEFHKLLNGEGSRTGIPKQYNLDRSTKNPIDIISDNPTDIDEHDNYDDDTTDNYENYETDESLTLIPHNNTPNLSSRENSATEFTTAMSLTQDKRKLLNIRKVRSEMKYIEPSFHKDTIRQKKKIKESKSDHESPKKTDNNVPQFEKNIGDTLSNSANHNIMNSLNYDQNDNSLESLSNIIDANGMKSTSGKNIPKFQLDNISMPTARSNDAYSTDSDTLRNNNNYELLQTLNRKSLEKSMRIPADNKQKFKGNSDSCDENGVKFEMDDISIPSMHSSDMHSSDSETLRNGTNHNDSFVQSLKALIRKNPKELPQPPTPMPSEEFKFKENFQNFFYNQSNGGGDCNNLQKCNSKKRENSPRSLFLGLRDN